MTKAMSKTATTTTTKLVCFVGILLAGYIKVRQAEEGFMVTTNSGNVTGIRSVSRDGRVFYEWLGIPYAKPPVGDLRFASPKPVEDWKGVIEAKEYGNVCAQFDLFTMSITGSEDCLNLNVHVPEKVIDSGKPHPVMVWIHGGYFICGSGSQYRPDFFMDEDVIVVSINYRLAALGFLSTGDNVVRGNMGLKDQSLALKWVQENIINFGGDPKQVTIFGESAGSSSVNFHMLSPMSQGLMQRAISQSGSALNVWALNEDPIGQAKRFAGKLNCPTESSSKMVECLRKMDVYDLLEIHRETTKLERTKEMVFVPTVEAFVDEETFLGDQPINLIKAGKMRKIPYLIGFNKDEGLIFGNGFRSNKEFRHELENNRTFMADVGLFLNETEKQHLDKILKFYFGSEERFDLIEQFSTTTELNTDRWFAYGIYKAALMHAEWTSVQVYYYNKIGHSLYDFTVMIQGKDYPILGIIAGLMKNWISTNILGIPPVKHGVCHVDEIAMLFELRGIFNVRQGDPHYEFSKDLVKTWTSFASAQNVSDIEFRGEKFPVLNPKGEVNVLEITDKPQAKRLPSQHRMHFWDSLYK